MKPFLLVIFLFCARLVFSQETAPRTYSGKPADSTTCVLELKLIDISPVDPLHIEVTKPKVSNLIGYLMACRFKFKFDKEFKDKDFKLIVPKYLNHVTYELGDQNFVIVLNDTTSLQRTIIFAYDLDDSFKQHFLSHNNEGFNKTGTVELNGQKIYRYKNWDDRIAGILFTTNHLEVCYFTKSKKFEAELQDAVSKFKW